MGLTRITVPRPLHYQVRLGYYIQSPLSLPPFTVSTMTPNWLVLAPFPLARISRVTGIRFCAEPGQAGKYVRLGLYNSGSNGLPNRLVHQSAAIGITGGYVPAEDTTIDRALHAGLYFAAAVANSTTAKFFMTYQAINLFEADPESAIYPTFGVVHAFGSLPDPCPAPPALMRDTELWAIQLRISAQSG